jgi:hypothetical protein
MSSIVALQGQQGFVISTDSIVFETATDKTGKVEWKVKGTTRKFFQLHEDVLAVGLGNWNSYFPIFNKIAAMKLAKDQLVEEVRNRCRPATTDAYMYIFHREPNGIILDIVENQQIRLAVSGAVMYPEPSLNSIFLTMYENEYARKIRSSGMMGIAALVNAYNAFALSLCSDISGPFDTILFTKDGIFNFSGGVTKLPVGEFT